MPTLIPCVCGIVLKRRREKEKESGGLYSVNKLLTVLNINCRDLVRELGELILSVHCAAMER